MPVQVYHHLSRSRVPLETVHHIIYLLDYPEWAHNLNELHTSKITATTAHIKSSQFAMSSPVIAWWGISPMLSRSHWLATVSQLPPTVLTAVWRLFSKTKSKLCYDQWSVGQSLLGWSIHLGPKTRFLWVPDSCGVADVERPLWREDTSVIYNRCWPLPAQSVSGPSPLGLMTIFWCLRLESSPTWRARSAYLYPPGTGWPSYTPRYW
jgi:hypothetical protein